jgi:antitoxin (DNA-binding transcriptional repressor) of toxin-antitoxin stability system
MIIVNTHEAKTRLSELLRAIEEKGERVRVCRNGRPIAEMGPVPRFSPDPLAINPRLSAVQFRESPVAPLAEEDWPESDR